MKIFELFDTFSRVTWDTTGTEGWRGRFSVDDLKFEIKIIPNRSPTESSWFALFALMSERGRDYRDTGLSGPKAKVVLATVQRALVGFIQAERPDEVSFDAAKRSFEERTDDADAEDHRKPGSGEGRASVYLMMLQRMRGTFERLGYQFKHFDHDGEERFVITKATPTGS